MLAPCQPVQGEIQPPGSKSITNRSIICAALGKGRSLLRGVLDSEDTQVMVEAWKQLGFDLRWDRKLSELSIVGCGGRIHRSHADIYVANSGTTIRFLTAALAIGEGEFVLDGVPRMRERPIEDLLLGLRQLGADVRSLNRQHPNCPPVLLKAHGLYGGDARIAGNVSSQFLSGLLMAAPYCQRDVRLAIEGELVSQTYVAMTTAVMREFGVSVESTSENSFRVQADQVYIGREYLIEPDASAASYFWATAAITGGCARVTGLSQNALQGDVKFVDALAAMGCDVRYGDHWIEVSGAAKVGIDIDMNTISDTVQTLAAVALFTKGPTRVRGVAHNRHKETDRIGDLACELRKLGAYVDEHDDGLTIVPGELRSAEIETYHDHRMAMSLALVGLKQPGVWIKNPRCTEKTYPEYFKDMARFTNQSLVYK